VDSAPDQPPSWERITADTALCRGPCWFVGIIVTDNHSDQTDVYDGQNAGGRLALSVRTVVAVNETVTVEPREPLYFQRGLFIDVPGSVVGVTVMWIPVPGPQEPVPPGRGAA
jgi:hypothetical protein